MKSKLIVLCSIILSLSGCDAFKKLRGGSTPDQVAAPTAQQATAPVDAAAKPPEELCADGQKPQEINGECGGTWKFEKNDASTVCNFDWGPKVTCPEGTMSLGREAECYGVTARPVESGDKVASDADCASKFGARPLEISYTMRCCPK